MEKLTNMVESLQSQSSVPVQHVPQQHIHTPPPPIPPRCPIQPSLSTFEHYENDDIALGNLSPPPLPPPLPSLPPPPPSPLPPPSSLHHKITPKSLPSSIKSAPNMSLPSSAIDKEKLKPAQDVLSANAHLASKVGKMTTLAVILAREAFFGDNVMGQCTAKSHTDKPGLPHNDGTKRNYQRCIPTILECASCI